MFLHKKELPGLILSKLAKEATGYLLLHMVLKNVVTGHRRKKVFAVLEVVKKIFFQG